MSQNARRERIVTNVKCLDVKLKRIRKKIHIFVEIMAKIFPKVLKSLKLQIQETQ